MQILRLVLDENFMPRSGFPLSAYTTAPHLWRHRKPRRSDVSVIKHPVHIITVRQDTAGDRQDGYSDFGQMSWLQSVYRRVSSHMPSMVQLGRVWDRLGDKMSSLVFRLPRVKRLTQGYLKG